MNGYRPPVFGGLPPVVKNLLIINVILLIATWALKSIGIDLTRVLALFYVESEYFSPYQYITHMFMHGGFAHLFFNMFALWMFGRVLESVWGSKKFLLYYFVTGLGAAALHTFVNWINLSSLQESATAFLNTPSVDQFMIFIQEYFPDVDRYFKNFNYIEFINQWEAHPENTHFIETAQQVVRDLVTFKINIPTVGASGAVFGVLLAFGMLFPNTQLMLLFPPIPIKAKYFVIGYGLIELYAGVMQQPGDNIAHFAHLGGMLFGFILIKYWNSQRSNFY